MKICKRLIISGLASLLCLMPTQTVSFSLSTMISTNKTATCLIGGLAITSAVLGYKVWKLTKFQESVRATLHPTSPKKSPEKSPEKPQSHALEEQIRAALQDKLHITQEWQGAKEQLESAEKTIVELRENAAFTTKCSEEAMTCLKKEQCKTTSIAFIFKAYDLKNSGKSLLGLAGLFKKQSGAPISRQSITELLGNMVRLKENIETLDKPWNLNEIDAAGNQVCSRLLSILKMKDPLLELTDTVQALSAGIQEITTIINTTSFKEPAAKASHEKLAIESGNQPNEAQLFVKKNQGLPAHQILGVANDAMMPAIVKAYRALSQKFHSDKAKDVDKPDYDQAMKMINDARETMVKEFNK